MINESKQNSLKRIDENMRVLESLNLNKNQLLWAQLLCNFGNTKDFVTTYNCSASSELAIMKYRRYLHKENIAIVNKIDIYDLFNKKEDIKLHNLLQNLFLEVITNKDYKSLMLCINNDCKNLQNICNMQEKNKGLKMRKVLRILNLY